MQRSYPSRLSRNELYSYGFKEGQPWADDRRSLEAALQAMERLELDIQQNYIERRSSPPYGHQYSAAPAPPLPHHYLSGSSTGRHYQAPQYPTPDVRIARSNDSGSSAESPQLSREWSSGGGSGIGYGNTGRGNQHWDTNDSSRGGWQSRDQSPPVLHRPSGRPDRYASPPPQYYAPPSATSPPGHRATNSSYRERDGSKGYYDSRQQSQQRQQQQFHRQYRSPLPTASPISSRHSGDSRTQPMSPSQWQVSRVVNGRGETYDEDRGSDGEQQQYHDYRGSPSAASANWSTGTNRDSPPGNRQLSVASSPGMYSEASLDSGYTRSSGYVESSNVSSRYSDGHPGYGPHGEQERAYHLSNDEHKGYHEEQGRIDDGELYDPEDDIEYAHGEDGAYSGHEGYSDGGYSDSASYSDGGSYDDDYD